MDLPTDTCKYPSLWLKGFEIIWIREEGISMVDDEADDFFSEEVREERRDSEESLKDESGRPLRLISKFKAFKEKERKCHRDGVNLPWDSNSSTFFERVGIRKVREPFSLTSRERRLNSYMLNNQYYLLEESSSENGEINEDIDKIEENVYG